MRILRLTLATVLAAALLAACGTMESAGTQGEWLSRAAAPPTTTFPTWQSGNAASECAQVGSFDFAFKVDPPSAGTYEAEGVTFTIALQPGNLFDWTATAPIAAVIVKGGPGANVWAYDPAATSDTGLYAPVNASGGPAGLSHITFCWNEPEERLHDLEVEKTAEGLYDRVQAWKFKKWFEGAYFHYGEFGSWVEPGVTWVIQAAPLDEFEDANHRVSGTITVRNPNPFEVEVSLADELDDGTVASITCDGQTDAASYVVPAMADDTPGTLSCTYDAPTVSAETTENTVTVTVSTVDGEDAPEGFGPFSDTADVVFEFSGTVLDAEMVLDDARIGIADMVITEDTTIRFTEPLYCDPQDMGEYVESIGWWKREIVNHATLANVDGSRVLHAEESVMLKCREPAN